MNRPYGVPGARGITVHGIPSLPARFAFHAGSVSDENFLWAGGSDIIPVYFRDPIGNYGSEPVGFRHSRTPLLNIIYVRHENRGYHSIVVLLQVKRQTSLPSGICFGIIFSARR
jgi:hypothetical protein